MAPVHHRLAGPRAACFFAAGKHYRATANNSSPRAWPSGIYTVPQTVWSLPGLAHRLVTVDAKIDWLPHQATQIYILDQHLQPVPVGVPGELYIGGTGLSRGYLGQPEMTADRFLPDPFSASGARLYKTGDLARFLPDGCIDFIGRVDHQIKIRGFRIELGEIESLLDRHPAVVNAVALCREDQPDQQQLVAYLEVDPSWQGEDHDVMALGDTQVEKWQTVWEQVYQEAEPAASVAEDAFDTRGWHSSYTGKVIPSVEMQHWVDETVNRILALCPAHVLEIGCGTGLLLSRLAPHTQSYIGTDFSKAVLDRLQRRVNDWIFDGLSLHT